MTCTSEVRHTWVTISALFIELFTFCRCSSLILFGIVVKYCDIQMPFSLLAPRKEKVRYQWKGTAANNLS